MLKKALLFCSALILIAGGLLGGRPLWLRLAEVRRGPDDDGVTHAHAGPTIEQVRTLASLVVLKVDVADVQVSQLHGYTGGAQVALVVKGDLNLSTDLSAARFASVDPLHRTAVLVLPPPRVSSPRVDQNRTRLVWMWQYGLWRIVPGDRADVAVVNRAYNEAQELVAAAGAEPMMDGRARSHAEAVLRTFFTAMDWSVTVRWSDRAETPAAADNLNANQRSADAQ